MVLKIRVLVMILVNNYVSIMTIIYSSCFQQQMALLDIFQAHQRLS